MIGLAQAHVVGEAAAEAEGGHQVQPGEAAQLVVAQAWRRGRRAAATGVDARRRGGRAARPARRPAPPRRVSPSTSARAGERGGERVDGVEQAQFALARLADERRVDEHPLVAQPDDRPVGLGEGVHLGLGERSPPSANCQRNWRSSSLSKKPVPSVAEPGARAHRPRRRVRSGPGPGASARRPRRRASRVAATPEQVVQLLLGQGQHVGHVLFGAGGPAGGQTRAARRSASAASTRARGPKASSAVARPQGGRVGDEGGVGEAVHLDDGGARACALPRRRRRARTPTGRGGARSARPRPCPRRPRRPSRGRRAAAAARARRRASRRRAARPGCAAGCRRPRRGRTRSSASGSGSRSGPVPGSGTAWPSCGRAAATARRWAMSSAVQRAGAPGVVAGRRSARAAAGRARRGAARAGRRRPSRRWRGGRRGRGGRARAAAGPRRRGSVSAGTVPVPAPDAVRPYDRQFGVFARGRSRAVCGRRGAAGSPRGRPVVRGGQRVAVRVPEGDPALARQGRGQEDGGEPHGGRTPPCPPGPPRRVPAQTRSPSPSPPALVRVVESDVFDCTGGV